MMHRARVVVGLVGALALMVLVGRAATAREKPRSTAKPAVGSGAGGIADLAWMSGSWRGENGGATVEEHWTPAAGGSLMGCGRTFSGEREQFFEFLKIEQLPGGGLVYKAWPKGRGPTPFTMTKLEGKHVVFENPDHDMPKKIEYSLNGDDMTARIEGDEGGKPASEEFKFKRVKE